MVSTRRVESRCGGGDGGGGDDDDDDYEQWKWTPPSIAGSSDKSQATKTSGGNLDLLSSPASLSLSLSSLFASRQLHGDSSHRTWRSTLGGNRRSNGHHNSRSIIAPTASLVDTRLWQFQQWRYHHHGIPAVPIFTGEAVSRWW